MQLQALTTFDPRQFFTPRQTSDAPAQRFDAQVSAVAISNDFSGRLSVTTDDGDRITLTADVESDFRAVDYASHVDNEQASVDVKASYVEYSLSREFGVTVEGDLSNQELHDLEKLFRKVSNIFRDFLHGQDEDGLAKSAKLADRFDHLSSLSSLDLSVDIERSITVLAAQVAAEVTSPSTLPVQSSLASTLFPVSTATPGGAPSTVAAIPQPSTGTTAPTPSSTDRSATDSTHSRRLTAPTAPQSASLIDQIFAALKEAKVELQKVKKHLPDFFDKLHEDLVKELRGEREHKAKEQNHTTPHESEQDPTPSVSSQLVAYQSVTATSLSLSLHS